jgi:ADP-ribosyl-[dinitrogen reductase] hydrolase
VDFERLSTTPARVPLARKRHSFSPEITEIANSSFKLKQPPETSEVVCLRSLEAPLWAFYSSYSFHERTLRALNLGNDADTTGAVYGQLAGACNGVNAIPDGSTAAGHRNGRLELTPVKTDGLSGVPDS